MSLCRERRGAGRGREWAGRGGQKGARRVGLGAWGRDSLCAKPALIGRWAHGPEVSLRRLRSRRLRRGEDSFWRRVCQVLGAVGRVLVVFGSLMCPDPVDSSGVSLRSRLLFHAQPPGGLEGKSLSPVSVPMSPRPSETTGSHRPSPRPTFSPRAYESGPENPPMCR